MCYTLFRNFGSRFLFQKDHLQHIRILCTKLVEKFVEQKFFDRSTFSSNSRITLKVHCQLLCTVREE